MITGVCIKYHQKEYVFSVKTKVFFNSMSEDLIKEYLDKEIYADKAGGYGIQQDDFNFIKYIKGSYTNVMGLPMKELIDHLENLNQLHVFSEEIESMELDYPKNIKRMKKTKSTI